MSYVHSSQYMQPPARPHARSPTPKGLPMLKRPACKQYRNSQAAAHNPPSPVNTCCSQPCTIKHQFPQLCAAAAAPQLAYPHCHIHTHMKHCTAVAASSAAHLLVACCTSRLSLLLHAGLLLPPEHGKRHFPAIHMLINIHNSFCAHSHCPQLAQYPALQPGACKGPTACSASTTNFVYD